MERQPETRGGLHTEACLLGGGEVGALMRSLDWSQVPLGPVANWPASLQAAVSLCLNSHEPIIIWWGPEWLMLYNDACRPILGKTKYPAALGQPGQLYWPESWPIIGAFLETVFSREAPASLENQRLALNRAGYLEDCYFTFSCSLIRDETGQVRGIFTLIKETSPKVVSEERFRELFENARDMIYTLDLDGNLTSLNKAGEHILGYRREEILYKPVDRLIAPEYLEATAEMRARKLAGEAVTTYELEAITKAGRRVTLEVSTSLIYKDDVPTGTQGIARDITERKSAEEALHHARTALEERVAERTAELERSLRELDQFTHAISHDLKAPLRALSYLVGWVSQDAAAVLPETSKEYLAKMQERIRRMAKQLDDLLLYARVGRRAFVKLESVDTGALVAEIIEVLAPPPDFEIIVQENMPTLRTPRVLLELVFKNLIENAIKHHHHPHGKVVVSAEVIADSITFWVSDDGPGIDEAFHERIFQMFQSLQPREETESTGVGLTLVKKAVESQGGAITVASATGQGTTFCFTWPRVDA